MGFLNKTLLVVFALAIATFLGRDYIRDVIFGGASERYSKSIATIKVELGNRRFAPPLNKVRHEHQRQDGTQQVLDLFFLWPALKGYSEETATVFNDPSQDWRIVLVTMEAIDEPIPSQSTRLNSVYRRFFKGSAWQGPNGLLGQKLSETSGYAGEDLYYGRNGDAVFVTRCLDAQAAKNANVPETCLHDFELVDGIQVIVRFDKNLLADWRLIPSTIKRELLSIMQS